MSKTYRDIRRAKYRQFVERWSLSDFPSSQYPHDLLVEQGELPHVCSPYCLIHWAKRVDRRKARLVGKRWLQAERWRDAERGVGAAGSELKSESATGDSALVDTQNHSAV